MTDVSIRGVQVEEWSLALLSARRHTVEYADRGPGIRELVVYRYPVHEGHLHVAVWWTKRRALSVRGDYR